MANIASRVKDYREEWKNEKEKSSAWIVPAVNLVHAVVKIETSEPALINIFRMFSNILNMMPSAEINAIENARRNEINKKLIEFERRLENTKFKEAVQKRIDELRRELDEL